MYSHIYNQNISNLLNHAHYRATAAYTHLDLRHNSQSVAICSLFRDAMCPSHRHSSIQYRTLPLLPPPPLKPTYSSAHPSQLLPRILLEPEVPICHDERRAPCHARQPAKPRTFAVRPSTQTSSAIPYRSKAAGLSDAPNLGCANALSSLFLSWSGCFLVSGEECHV